MRFSLLGPVEVHDNADRPVTVSAPMQRAVLAALALRDNRPVSSAALVAALWNTPPASAHASLLNYIARLRRVLGPELGGRIRSGSVGYTLEVRGADELDLLEFGAAQQQGLAAVRAGDWPLASVALGRALAVWRGEPLADLRTTGDLLEARRRLEGLRVDAVQWRIEADLRTGRHEQVMVELRELVTTHPMDERFHAQLMLALYRSGRQAEALRAFADVRTLLVTELAVEPGAELQLLHQRILRADRDLAVVGPVGPSAPVGSLVPVGAPGLDALTDRSADSAAGAAAALAAMPAPDTTMLRLVHMGGIPGIAPAASALRTQRKIGGSAATPPSAGPGAAGAAPARWVAPRQLPLGVADFTGRDEQVAGLRGALSGSDDAAQERVVVVSTISGSGGMGKTTLAVHAAHLVAADFPDGQLFLNLLGACAEPRSPADLLAIALLGLGVASDAVPAGEDARIARYRTLLATRRVLVVLDDARHSAQVRALTPGTGGSAVLVTSRSRLPGLTGALRLELDVLDADASRALFAGVVGAGRVAAEPQAAAAILECCAGLPLAVRIAGARLAARPAWSLAAFAARLRDERRRLDQLQVEDIAVRASLEVSYRSLHESSGSAAGDPARTFRLLGLAGGSDIGLPAAAALLGEPLDRTEDLLEHLVDNCLLDTDAHGRYHLHDLLRVYAAECAVQDESEASRRAALARLAHWYLGSAQAATEVLGPGVRRPEVPPPDPAHPPLAFDAFPAALRWYDQEQANLVTVVEYAARYALSGPVALLGCFMWSYFRLCSKYDAWQTTNTIALAAARAAGDRAGEAVLLNSQAALCQHQGRGDEAEACLRSSLEIRRELGDAIGESTILSNLAVIYLADPAKLDQARELALQALVLAQALGRQNTQANVHNTLGRCADRSGDYAGALTHYRASSALHAQLNDIAGVVVSDANIGAVHLHAGEHDLALRRLNAVLPACREVGNRVTEAEIEGHLGQAHAALGRTEEARNHLRRAHTLWQQLDATRAEKILAEIEALTTPGRPSTPRLPARP